MDAPKSDAFSHDLLNCEGRPVKSHMPRLCIMESDIHYGSVQPMHAGLGIHNHRRRVSSRQAGDWRPCANLPALRSSVARHHPSQSAAETTWKSKASLWDFDTNIGQNEEPTVQFSPKGHLACFHHSGHAPSARHQVTLPPKSPSGRRWGGSARQRLELDHCYLAS